MNRKQFVMGVLSAAATGMIVTKEDVALAEDVRKSHADTNFRYYTSEGLYEFETEGTFVNRAYFMPRKGVTSSRMYVHGWDRSAVAFVVETREFGSDSLLHRSAKTMPYIYRGELRTRLHDGTWDTLPLMEDAGDFGNNVQDFFEWYVAEYNTKYLTPA